MPIFRPSKRAWARNLSLFSRHHQATVGKRATIRCLQMLAIASVLVSAAPGWAQDISPPTVQRAVRPVTVPALARRTMTAPRQWQPGQPVIVQDDLKVEGSTHGPAMPAVVDPVLQKTPLPDPSVTPPLVIDQRVDGIAATGTVPPDITFAVGPNHVVEMVNNSVAVYDKSTKAKLLLGPVVIHSFWDTLPNSPCARTDGGDPIVRYDHFADRWLISQFQKNSRVQCIAISKGPDPVNDKWCAYAFELAASLGQAIGDYPKIAVWPDGYYMGTQRGWSNLGVDVWAFERAKMLTCDDASLIHFAVSGPSTFLMPSDVDGQAPPTGWPNFFARHVNGAIFGGQDRLEIFEFVAKWDTSGTSTFTKVATLPTAAYNAVLCGEDFKGNCAPQPGTTVKLETAPAWLMWRLQFRMRTFGIGPRVRSAPYMVVNHTVNADGNDRAGIRWYILTRQPTLGWQIAQQGTYSPDSDHRFIGSMAMNERGDIALGFAVSGPNTYPSIRVAFKGVGDANAGGADCMYSASVVGCMSQQRELTLVAGSGSQTHSSGRWGDYSSMEVDPQSPCKFWYAHEYYASTSLAGWKTAITSFQPYDCEPGVNQGPSSMAALGSKGNSTDCQNRDVQMNNSNQGAGGVVSSSRFKNGDNSIGFVSVYVSLSYGNPNTTYHTRIRCGPFIGDMTTSGQGGGNRGFDFPSSLVGSQYGLEFYVDGDPGATLETTTIPVQ